MHVVIMGCGRVGSVLAQSLASRDHSVAVIDQNPAAFRRLGPDFDGQSVTGVGFDKQVLAEAGIARADAFAAVSSGDNSNIIAARVAREVYQVSTVVARIYDSANPLSHLIVEQTISSAPYYNRCHHAALSDLSNRIGYSSTPECFAVGQTIQRKSKAAVPLYRAPERGCCCFDAGVLEGRVKNDSLDISQHIECAMDMRLDIVVEHWVEI